MASEDRFGLQGDPEIKEARRVPVGTGSLDILFLGLTTLLSAVLIWDSLSPWQGLPSALGLLSAFLVVWGWWQWRHNDLGRGVGLLVYLLVTAMKYAQKLLLEVTTGQKIDLWSVVMFLLCFSTAVFYGTQRQTQDTK